MFGSFMNPQKSQRTREDDGPPPQQSLLTRPNSLSLSSVSLNSIKSQTAKMSTQVFSSLRTQSNRVSKLLWSDGSETTGNKTMTVPEPRATPPTILEQLKWPALNNRKSWLLYLKNENVDEEDIVDKFIRVITSEDCDERPEETFYNHPARVILGARHIHSCLLD